jgi:hypothetical protein
MTTQLDGIVVPNSAPARVGRKDKKVLSQVKAEIDESIAALVVASGQYTTGTTTTAGEIAIAGMTANGKVIVTAAEAVGTGLILSHVVAASGKITVYTTAIADNAVAALSGKKVNVIVIAK